MRTFRISVTQTIDISLDETKFDAQFMDEFRQHFFPFDAVEEHAEHLAQLCARGVYDLSPYSSEFVEGYGPSLEMGIKAVIRSTDTEFEAEIA